MGRAFYCVVIGLAIATSLITGCGDTVFGGSGDDSASGEGGASDATVDASADGASEDGGDASAVSGNLLADPGFESTMGAGCGSNWTIGTGTTTLALAPIGHTGSYSCLVCALSSNVGGLITNPAVEPLANLDAGTYEGAAWVMPVSVDAGPATPFVIPGFYQGFHDGGAQASGDNAFNTPAGVWTQVYYAGDLESDNFMQFLINVFPDSDAGVGCALIDDVSLIAE